MSNVVYTPIQQQLQARIIRAEKPSYWYAGLIGMKFEVKRNPNGIKLINSEAKKVKHLLGHSGYSDYYIADGDCRIIRIGDGEPNE